MYYIFYLKDMSRHPFLPNVIHTTHLFTRPLNISFPSYAPKSGNSIDSFTPTVAATPSSLTRAIHAHKPPSEASAAPQMDYHYLGSFIFNTS